MNSCNVCGKACTKHCSRCRSVYYCSAKCQKIDWKRGHKRECKGKLPKKSDTDHKLDSLPDAILVHIGKSVLELSGVHSFIRLAQTSKRIYGILMNKGVIPNILESENERIFHKVFYSNVNVAKASSLEEMALCQYLSNINKQNRIFFDGLNFVDSALATGYVLHIGFTLMKHPSAEVLIDTHLGRDPPLDFSQLVNLPSPSSEMLGKIRERFEMSFKRRVGKKKTLELLARFRIRKWEKTAFKFSSKLEDALGTNVREGMGWMAFTFRMGSIELPPPPDFYKEIDTPKENRLDAWLVVEYLKQPPDGDPEEKFLTCLGSMNDGLSVEQNKIVLDAWIDKLRNYHRTGMGEEFDMIMWNILRVRNDRLLQQYKTTGTTGNSFHDEIFRKMLSGGYDSEGNSLPSEDEESMSEDEEW